MRMLILAAWALAVLCAPAAAGPNAGGTLIVHNPEIVYCVDVPTFCGVNPLADCASAVTRMDTPEPVAKVWKMYAAFPADASPRLKGIAFGILYDANVVVIGHGACAEFELPEEGWPGSNTGNGMVWNETQTGHLTEVYWFAGYAYYGQATFRGIPHPDGNCGCFADDGVPSILDEIAAYGVLGFNQEGEPACPPPPIVMGACCTGLGECTVTTEADCDGCAWMPGYSCDPNPCPIFIPGACCLPDGRCIYVGCVSECTDQGGTFLGTETTCYPNPCDTPVRESTWGSIKHQYR